MKRGALCARRGWRHSVFLRPMMEGGGRGVVTWRGLLTGSSWGQEREQLYPLLEQLELQRQTTLTDWE